MTGRNGLHTGGYSTTADAVCSTQVRCTNPLRRAGIPVVTTRIRNPIFLYANALRQPNHDLGTRLIAVLLLSAGRVCSHAS